MSIDVEALAKAIRDHDDICSQMAIPECATAIAAEYARLVPAEDAPQLVKVPNLGDNPSYFVKATVPAEDEWLAADAATYRRYRLTVDTALSAAEDEGRLREALEIIAAAPQDAPDAIGVSARNIARAALAATPEPR